MAVPRFLKIAAGVIQEVLTIASSAGAGDADKVPATDAAGRLDASFMPGGAPVNTSAGAGDAGKLPKLDAAGKLDNTMMPSGVGADALSVVTSENLAAGDLVNVYNNGGTLTARKADATAAGKEANGFVISASTSPTANTVYFDGTISGMSGLTVGADYFLHTTAGAVTTTAPSGTGKIVQRAGKALSATTMSFQPSDPVTLA